MLLAVMQTSGSSGDDLFFLVGSGIILVVAICLLVSGTKKDNAEKARRDSLPKDELEMEDSERQFGGLNLAMVCQHCQSKGKIRTKKVDKKAGISGGKATAALLTGGVSIIATGLSRKEDVTQAHCEECKNTWTF